jgi:TPR repeat protein
MPLASVTILKNEGGGWLMKRVPGMLFVAIAIAVGMAGSATCGEIEGLRARAEKGDAGAQAALGAVYLFGEVVPRDYGLAMKWYRKAAEQGKMEAQYALGYAYAGGIGVLQDFPESVRWYRKAAEQGDAEAQVQLGFAYYYGKGISKNHQEAAAWFNKAAEQGNARAQNTLGFMYGKGEGVAQSNSSAVEWYYKAGTTFLNKGERYDAILALDRINAISPGDPLGKTLDAAISPVR